MTLQKVATQIFIYASISFGIIGVIIVAVMSDDGGDGGEFLFNILAANVFVILASFAVSVAGKFLSSK
jgi:hypothetical protein